MEAEELAKLEGPSRGQLDLLADKLQITTLRQLIMTERQPIVGAFGRRKNRPTLEEVAEWQDAARQSIAAATVDSSAAEQGWDQVAAFVVAFEERRGQEGVERRVVAEQTEVEPDARREQRQVANGWTSVTIHEWMVTRVDASAPESNAVGESATTAKATRPIGDTPDPDPERRHRIEIQRVVFSSRGREVNVAVTGVAAPAGRSVWDRPDRLTVDFSGPTGEATTVVTLGLTRPDGTKLALSGDVDTGRGRAHIDLHGLTAGAYRPRLLLATPDASWLPSVVEMPWIDLVTEGSSPNS